MSDSSTASNLRASLRSYLDGQITGLDLDALVTSLVWQRRDQFDISTRALIDEVSEVIDLFSAQEITERELNACLGEIADRPDEVTVSILITHGTVTLSYAGEPQVERSSSRPRFVNVLLGDDHLSVMATRSAERVMCLSLT